MRPIKFRAWEKRSKLMWQNVQNAYDTLGDHGNGEEILIPHSFGELLKDDGFIVMQFTGLYDKDRKEIYEKDVLQDPLNPKYRYEVKFYPDHACFKAHHIGSSWNAIASPSSFSTMERVGNSYENPNLLNS